MSKRIDDEFLERNLFEKAKVGCGYFPWTYYDKKYEVVIAPWTDSGRSSIWITNEETKETIEYERKAPDKVTQEDLHRCIKFMNVPDEFEYDSDKTCDTCKFNNENPKCMQGKPCNEWVQRK